MCAGCGLKTSATAGTIFHRSHTPLSTWFAAVWFVTSQKNGVSAKGLHDVLGFGSYETAWAWLHKLRRAMVRPERELLEGAVELDQSFLGGKSTGRQGASSGKAPITIAVERTVHGRLGRVRLELADKPGGLDMIEFACEVITPGASIHTDGARMFTRLTDKGYTHHATPGNTTADRDTVMPGPPGLEVGQVLAIHSRCALVLLDLLVPPRPPSSRSRTTCPSTSTGPLGSSRTSGRTPCTGSKTNCGNTPPFNSTCRSSQSGRRISRCLPGESPAATPHTRQPRRWQTSSVSASSSFPAVTSVT